MNYHYIYIIILFFISCKPEAKRVNITNQPDKINIDSLENCFSPKYSFLFDKEHDYFTYFDYEQGLECAKKMNKPILLRFTGWGNPKRKKVEQSIFLNKEIKDFIKKNYVLITIYVDDRTILPKKYWYESQSPYGKGRVMRNLIDKNGWLQIHLTQSGTQPYIVTLSNKEKILQKSLYSRTILQNPPVFLDSIKNGWNKNYEKQ